jgi:hypothetical protein
MRTNATEKQLQRALRRLNKEYKENNFTILTSQRGKWVNIRLKSISGRPGSRVSHSGRKIPFPSYYAIGRFFEILFDMDPNIKIYSLGKRIEPNEIWSNWSRQLEYIERGSILEQ